jgi:hypothetical protein
MHMLTLVGRDTYINAAPISKYFITVLCIITGIKNLAIMMKCIIKF